MTAGKSLTILLLASLASAPSLADAVKAKQNYDRYCSACHGFNGMSISAGVPNLRMNEGLLQPDYQIIQKLKLGSPKKPPMLGMLKDQELQEIVTYTRTLR